MNTEKENHHEEEPFDVPIFDRIDDEQRVVNLWNKGGELVQAGRYTEALPLWEEALALEEEIGHPDLEEDREQLERLRTLIDMPQDVLENARAAVAQADDIIEQQLAALPPSLRAGVEEQLREFMSMPPDEQEAILSQIEDTLADAQESELALDVDPSNRPAYLAALWDRGNGLIDAGRYSEALPFWEEAVQIAVELNHPQLPAAQQALGFLRSALDLEENQEQPQKES